MFLRRTLLRAPGLTPALGLVILIIAGGLGPVASASAGGKECLSSKLTNQLLDCEHCQNVKKLLGHAAIGAVSMEVHDLEHGAVVQIEAATPAAVPLVHQIVEQIWNASGHCDTKLSGVCQERFHALGKIMVDRALTSHGAIVVLRSDDPEQVAWLRQDALNTRSIVFSAATR
jgi:hypothetical protein